MWLIWALAACLLWGLWGYFAGLAVKAAPGVSAPSLLAVSYLIAFLVLSYNLRHVKQALSWQLCLTAALGVAAYIAFYSGLKLHPPTGVFVAVTAAYPAITLLLTLVAGGIDVINVRQIVGSAVIVTGIVLVAV